MMCHALRPCVRHSTGAAKFRPACVLPKKMSQAQHFVPSFSRGPGPCPPMGSHVVHARSQSCLVPWTLPELCTTFAFCVRAPVLLLALTSWNEKLDRRRTSKQQKYKQIQTVCDESHRAKGINFSSEVLRSSSTPLENSRICPLPSSCLRPAMGSHSTNCISAEVRMCRAL